MTCKLLDDVFDDYIDGICPDAMSLDQHVASCGDCRARVAREHRLRTLLGDYAAASVPRPEAGFFTAAVAGAIRQQGRQRRNKRWLQGLGGALAASLLLWFVAGDWAGSPVEPRDVVPQITMTLENPRTINLVFSSATDLNDATLTVSLPPGIDMQGFQGQREITWMTSLRQGRNVLPLKLIATSPVGGELLATLRHEDDDRTFRLQVSVTQEAS